MPTIISKLLTSYKKKPVLVFLSVAFQRFWNKSISPEINGRIWKFNSKCAVEKIKHNIFKFKLKNNLTAHLMRYK